MINLVDSVIQLSTHRGLGVKIGTSELNAGVYIDQMEFKTV